MIQNSCWVDHSGEVPSHLYNDSHSLQRLSCMDKLPLFVLSSFAMDSSTEPGEPLGPTWRNKPIMHIHPQETDSTPSPLFIDGLLHVSSKVYVIFYRATLVHTSIVTTFKHYQVHYDKPLAMEFETLIKFVTCLYMCFTPINNCFTHLNRELAENALFTALSKTHGASAATMALAKIELARDGE